MSEPSLPPEAPAAPEGRGALAALEAVANAVPLGVVVLDDDLRIQLVNGAAREHLSHLCARQVGEILSQLGGHPLANLLRAGADERIELECEGRTYELFVSTIPHGGAASGEASGGNSGNSGRWILVIDDVTQRREVQQRAQVQDRLAAIGQLAAGIAHDFNNLLAVIMLHAQIGLLQNDLPPALRDCLDTILTQAVRAGDLVQQVLDFGRRATLERRPLRLGPFVGEQVRLLSRTLPENITLRFDDESAPHAVNADPTRLQQVIVNLALNARDAMNEGGDLRIVIDSITVGEEGEQGGVQAAAPLPALGPGKWVRLHVIDSGQGIPPHVLPRIFEPFFTTKTPQGTGLGLAQVHAIVKQHEGEIAVASEQGRGTTFTLYLPAAQAAEAEPEPATDDVLALGHGETVLVVEDDRAVRMALVASLEQLDYQPLEARNGREALSILLRRPNDIALVLSDMIMPEMGGMALLDAFKEHNVTTPLVFLSGRPMDNDLQTPTPSAYAGWLQKPVNLESLARLLARILAPK